MSITAIRDAFNSAAPADMQCTAARLHFCDAQGGTEGPRIRCRVEFDLANGATFDTGVLPAGQSVYEAVRTLARHSFVKPEAHDGA